MLFFRYAWSGARQGKDLMRAKYAVEKAIIGSYIKWKRPLIRIPAVGLNWRPSPSNPDV
jgi:hypothetical protein